MHSIYDERIFSLETEIQTLQIAAKAQEELVVDGYTKIEKIIEELEKERDEANRVNEKLHETNDFIERVMDTMDEVLLILDTRGRIRRINLKCANLLGYTPIELIHKNVDILVSEWELERFKNEKQLKTVGESILYALFSYISRFECIINLKPKHGDYVTHLLRGSNLISRKGKKEGIVIVGTDINELRKTQLTLSKTVESLRLTVEELDNTVRKLNEKENLLEKELLFAANIQKGIFPSNLEPWKNIHFGVYFRPMGIVSGDYYDMFRFENDVFLLLCDISGHGVPAALVTMAAKYAFSSFTKENSLPSEIFIQANKLLEESIKTSDYLTAFMLKIDSNNLMTYSNASHPMTIFFDSIENNVFLLDSSGVFIGALKEVDEYYENKTLQLNAGDKLFLYTDGATEQKNKYEQSLEVSGLIDWIYETNSLSIQAQIQELSHRLISFIGDAPIKDDISIIGIEIK